MPERSVKRIRYTSSAASLCYESSGPHVLSVINPYRSLVASAGHALRIEVYGMLRHRIQYRSTQHTIQPPPKRCIAIYIEEHVYCVAILISCHAHIQNYCVYSIFFLETFDSNNINGC